MKNININLLTKYPHLYKTIVSIKSLKKTGFNFFIILEPDSLLKEETYLDYCKKIREFHLNFYGVYTDITEL